MDKMKEAARLRQKAQDKLLMALNLAKNEQRELEKLNQVLDQFISSYIPL